MQIKALHAIAAMSVIFYALHLEQVAFWHPCDDAPFASPQPAIDRQYAAWARAAHDIVNRVLEAALHQPN